MLNLLPEEIKSRHKTRSKLYSVMVFYIVIGAVFILGPLALTTYNFVLGTEVADYQSKIEQVNTQIGRSKDISGKLAFLETRVAGSAQFQEQRSWDQYLIAIAAAVPTSITVTGIGLEQVTNPALPTMAVAGTTSDRREIILFRDKLMENKTFTNIAITSITETIVDVSKLFSFSITFGVASQ